MPPAFSASRQKASIRGTDPFFFIVIASRSQLVGDLADAFALLRKSYGAVPAFVSFITGPSRTGDIERILVLGAHGPKKLTVLLVEA